MNRREVAALGMRLEALGQHRRMLGPGGASDRARFRFAHAVRGGADCFLSRDLGGFAPRVLGFGLFAPPTVRGLDAIRRLYAAARQPTRIFLMEGAVPLEAVRLLERAGFERSPREGTLWARTTARPPTAAASPGLDVARLAPERARGFAAVMAAGFEAHGKWRFFSRATARNLAAYPRSMAGFIARRDGALAGSGALLESRGAGLLFAGSVVPAERGRGVQPALIAARLAHGWARGARAFYSVTAPDNASARNIGDAGFTRCAVLAAWIRED